MNAAVAEDLLHQRVPHLRAYKRLPTLDPATRTSPPTAVAPCPSFVASQPTARHPLLRDDRRRDRRTARK